MPNPKFLGNPQNQHTKIPLNSTQGKTSLDLNEARDDGVLVYHMQTICTSLQTDNDTNTSPLNFYRPDAFPDAQPTMSKHTHTLKEQIIQKVM